MEGQFLSGVIEGFYGKPWTSEQRMKLFARLNKLGMNTYLYAPKDDIKHRSAWRELYTVEELDIMSGLIEAADRQNVNFVYALSPGIDIIYSSTADMNCLKRKFDQIQGIGCRSFALLFDDIKNELPDSDRDHYHSLGMAQAMVTNEIYEHLQLPRVFLFCPTEYCTSRARPTIADSHYLQTIGSKLLPSIEILWTGPKVVSRKITIQSVEELSDVLKRPPLIWDNIHANDYDYSRMFLGPFEGRSSELRPYVRGILTNPNCEFEANFVALHTLSQWTKCSKDAVKKDIILTGSPVPAEELQLEMDGDFVPDDDNPIHCCNQLYIPRRALKLAISEWHDEFLLKSNAPADFVYSYQSPLNVVPPVDPSLPTMALLPDVKDEIPIGFAGADIPPAVPKQGSGLAVDLPSGDDKVDLNGEPMDCCTAASLGSADPSDVSEVSTDDANVAGEIMQIDSDATSGAVTLEDLTLLVDLFYLPFEYGPQTTELLNELDWIISNIGHHDWTERQGFAINRLQSITDLINRVCDTPNRAIVVEFYPYLWATKIVVSLLTCFLQWVGLGKVPASSQCFVHGGPATWSSQEYQVQLTSGDYEPWLMKGGFIRELQKMLPFECSSDLLVYACPLPSENVIFTVRPYQTSDESAVLNLYKRLSNNGNNNNLNSTPTNDELQFDAIAEVSVGSFLYHNPEFCFVVENAQGTVCAYVLAALNAVTFFEKVESLWIPAVNAKYKEALEKNTPSSSEEIMQQLEAYKNCLLDNQISMYPSLLRIDFNPDELLDRTALKRALSSAIAALKVNGSCGVYTQGPVMHDRLREFYLNLGLFEVGFRNGVSVLGRNISLSHLISSSPSSAGKPASAAKWCHMCYCCNVV